MKVFRIAPILLGLWMISGCAGSTKFITDPPDITILPGNSDTVELTLEAIGSHAGTYTITAESQATGLTVTVSPTSAEVDGTVVVTVNVTVATSVASDSSSVSVQAKKDGDDVGAGMTFLVRHM